MKHVLETAGPLSTAIAELFWLFVIISAAVYAVVIGFLVYALRRRHAAPAAVPQDGDAPAPPAAPADTRKAIWAIGIGVGATSMILVVLAVSDFLVGRALAATPADPLRVRITAHQWWWEIEYVDPQPMRRVRTANELHIPVGRPVLLEMTADDVIHSFWVPSLQGKKDLLPGYVTTLTLIASRAGLYGGQCAEFCGFQHANMAIDVVAHDAQEFSGWYEAQLAPAAQPATPEARRGRDVFMTSTCVMCHNILGTDASAIAGPDLTHVASRRRLAAGTLPNEPTKLAAWIRNPQAFKPGTRMPATALAGEDLAALSAYLSSLR
jgi:cytochrome c oxidase subunit II